MRHLSVYAVIVGGLLTLGPGAFLTAQTRSSNSASSGEYVRREFSVRTPDGLAIAAEERGRRNAPAIVFIHGLAHSRASWLRQLDSPLAHNFRLVAYDLRGHGHSEQPQGDVYYTEGQRWGDELAAVIDAAQVRKPVLVAWSLGGVVVINYLRDHGERNIAGVVFVDAVTHFSPELFGEGNAALVQPLQSPDTAIRTAATRRFIEACFAVPPLPAELDSILSNASVLPAYVHVAVPRISLDHGDEVLRSIHVPTLVVHGEKDGLTSLLMSRRTAGLVAGSRLSIYPDAGHAPFFDATKRFNNDLASFVADRRRAGAPGRKE